MRMRADRPKAKDAGRQGGVVRRTQTAEGGPGKQVTTTGVGQVTSPGGN